jgi:hypothetical protein
MRKLLLICALFLSACATTPTPTPIDLGAIFDLAPAVVPPGYDTLTEAAFEAFKAVAAKPTSIYYEWGGIIVQLKSGKYAPLPAVTTFEGDHVSISGPGMFGKVVATYHTHPCVPEHYSEFFSPPDLSSAIFEHMTVFMGDLCTGHIHEFKPGDKPDVEAADHDDLPPFLTKGRIIGQFTTPHSLLVAE